MHTLNQLTFSASTRAASAAAWMQPTHSPANRVFSKLFSTLPCKRSIATRHSFCMSWAERNSANAGDGIENVRNTNAAAISFISAVLLSGGQTTPCVLLFGYCFVLFL